MPVSYCFDDCSFVVKSEVREPDSIFLSQDCCAYGDLSCFHIKLKNFCFISMETAIASLIGIILKSIDHLG